MWLQILLATVIVLGAHSDDRLPFVKTPLGEIRGYYKTSHDGRTFSSFEGIPYAKPPIEEKRFEEPEPAEPWQGIWNASHVTECAQTVFMEPTKPTGDEDCLHINVYVPRKNPNPEESLDVIVHIHGGAYMHGSGNSFASPNLLMDKEVIYVSFNYRLGIFGFLSTEDDVVPGNNGLKDQTMALQWIQQNIKSFGGNPDSVTITGSSAGGSSVHLHYFSKLSRGLFHRGFSESGLALNPFSIQEKPLSKTKKLADALGCPTSSTRLLVDCLKQQPAEDILAQRSLFVSYLVFPIVPFGPVVEKGGSKPFLDADPYILFTKEEVYDVPFIAATTSHEGLFMVTTLMDTIEFVDKNWEKLAPDFLEFNNTVSPSLWKSTARRIKEFYLGSKRISSETMMNLIEIFTDRFFSADAETAVRMQAKVNKSPVYYYVFGYPGDNNPQKLVNHVADSKYLYGPTDVSPLPLTPNELKMKDLLLNMVIEFMKTGKPVFGDIDWKPTNDDRLTYLSITGIEPEENALKTADNLNNRDFWKSLQLAEGENLLLVKDEL